MLNYLSIKNYTLIEDVFLEFSSGFNVLTGETGAGKSIIVGALGLVLGERAASGLIRKGAGRLSITASFKVISKQLEDLLVTLGLNDDIDDTKHGEMLLRRDIDSSGRSRCFVNDNPVSLSSISKIGEFLVDVHGQHEHQLLLKNSEQRDLIDSFGGLTEYALKIEELYKSWKELLSEQDALSLSVQERTQRIDLYSFQLKELKTANLRPGEEEELEKMLPRLKNAERLKSLSEEAYGLLYGEEGSALDRLRQVQRDFDGICNLGGELSNASEMLKGALIQLEETSNELDGFRDGIETDPERLEEVLGRLELMSRLKRKYGNTVEEILEYKEKISKELDHLEHAEEKTQDISEQVSKAYQKFISASKKMSEERRAVAEKLSGLVHKELKELGLGNSKFRADIIQEKDESGKFKASANGIDDIEFLISPNPGEDLKPLADTASGGELSRIMLALKTVLSKADKVPTLIFDEIDSGVGGFMGAVVGKKLLNLGKARQVICITHLPQIASLAHRHFNVEKYVEGKRTHVAVSRLDSTRRIKEISRLLGGETKISVKHARELIEQNKQ